MPRPLDIQQPIKPLEAGLTEPDVVPAAAVAATAVVVGCVFALVAASVAGASALPAVFLCHQPSVFPASGGPGLAFAEAFDVPDPALPEASVVVAGISCPDSDSQCSEQRVVGPAGGRWDGLQD